MIPDEVREALQACIHYTFSSRVIFNHALTASRWLDSQPVAPEPDWSTAPKWAMWYAVDGIVRMYEPNAAWFEYEPTMGETNATWWNDHRGGLVTNVPVDPLPLGVDWRTTLRQRPKGD